MTGRRLLLAVGGEQPSGPLPPDPTLVEPRHFTGTLGINQNVFDVPVGGTTYRTSYPVIDIGPRPLDDAGEVTVPDGFLYILGDHRDAAQDSRLARGVRGTAYETAGGVVRPWLEPGLVADGSLGRLFREAVSPIGTIAREIGRAHV